MKLAANQFKKAVSALESFSAFLPEKAEVVPTHLRLEGEVLSLSVGATSAKMLLQLPVESHSDEKLDRSVDIGSLAAVRLSGTMHIEVQEKSLLVFGDNLKASLPFVPPDNSVDLTKEVELGLEMSKQEFVQALSLHNYGGHHNPEEAERRPVRVFSQDGHLRFQSYDKQVSAFSAIPYSGPDLDFQLLPKPLLSTLEDLDADSFKLGSNFQGWKLAAEGVTVWFPNLIKLQKGDFTPLLTQIENSKSYQLQFKEGTLDSALSRLAPFMKAKTEVPKVSIQVLGQQRVLLKTVSAKSESVEVEVPSADFELSLPDMHISGKETVVLNFRYLKEFLSNLGKESCTLQWWEALPESPLKGKALSVFNARGRYIIARLQLD